MWHLHVGDDQRLDATSFYRSARDKKVCKERVRLLVTALEKAVASVENYAATDAHSSLSEAITLRTAISLTLQDAIEECVDAPRPGTYKIPKLFGARRRSGARR